MCILGFVLGLIIQFQTPSDDVIAVIGFPGRLFYSSLEVVSYANDYYKYGTSSE
eukprot:TRINITY_DN5856_c0_g1_i1.p2 TRINITY_DN5856_c0_g1~~TRINITY_DN5856_c0_g1_i1.p2  ORF type:complete len:54 (+),score=5.23 TRINITY_DN5856_c0_g1_i1:310-471(+)